MDQLLCLLIVLTASSSIISAGNDTSALTSNTAPPIKVTLSPWPADFSTVQTTSEKSVTSDLTSHQVIVTTSQTTTTARTTTNGVFSSSHTGSTDIPDTSTVSSSKSTSGSFITIISSTTTSQSYTDTTQNTPSSSTAKSTVGVPEFPKTLAPTNHSNTSSELIEGTEAPPQTPGNSLTMLAFGVMSLILILIVVMVILVTAVNLRGRCKDKKQQDGIKGYDSVVSDSNMTNNCEKESITLVSVRSINSDNDTDSPQVSSVRSTIVDNDETDLNRDLLNSKAGL